MKLKAGDEIVYSYNGFVFRMKLVELYQKQYWKCSFIANMGIRSVPYRKGEVIPFPKEYMRKLTKLERALR